MRHAVNDYFPPVYASFTITCFCMIFCWFSKTSGSFLPAMIAFFHLLPVFFLFVYNKVSEFESALFDKLENDDIMDE